MQFSTRSWVVSVEESKQFVINQSIFHISLDLSKYGNDH